MQLFEAIQEQQAPRNWEAKISKKKENHWVSLTFLPLLLVKHLPVCNRFRWKSKKIVTVQRNAVSQEWDTNSGSSGLSKKPGLEGPRKKESSGIWNWGCELFLFLKVLAYLLTVQVERWRIQAKKSWEETEKLNRAIHSL